MFLRRCAEGDRRDWRQDALSAGLAAALAMGLGCGASTTPSGNQGEGGSSETGGPEFNPPEPLSDFCIHAPPLGFGTVRGSLRDADDERGGACGGGGPEVFATLRMPRRGDLWVKAEAPAFSPRLELADASCQGVDLIACAEAPAEIRLEDLRAGTEITVGVGIDPGAGALETPTPEPGEEDALGFRLEIDFDAIYEPGESCGPPRTGRCAPGSACLVGTDPSGIEDRRCTPVVGDSCASVWRLGESLEALSEGVPVFLELDLPFDTEGESLLSDTQPSSCAAGSRDLVLALDWPEGLGHLDAGAAIRVEAASVLGLELKGPACVQTPSLGCVAAEEPESPQELSLQLEGVAEMAARGDATRLLVELPSDLSELSPLLLRLEVVEG